MKLADLHVHSNYSPDSNAAMEDHIKRGIEMGLDILCFSDHIECGEIFTTYPTFPFAKRAEEFHRLKAKYASDIKLLLGVEFGEPHIYTKELDFIHTLDLDLIIGSVHYPMDLSVSYTTGEEKRRHYEQMYRQYVLDMVKYGGFDMVGHIDMPKRYHADYVADDSSLHEALRYCVQNNLVPEMNTSTIRQKSLPPMIDIDAVKYYQSIGGKYITINSDAHFVCDLACDLKETALTLPEGIKRCYFEKRQLIELD